MDDTNNRWNVVIGLTLAGLLVTAGLAGCEQELAKQEAPVVETKSEPAAGEVMQDMSAADEATQDMPAAGTISALMAPASSP